MIAVPNTAVSPAVSDAERAAWAVLASAEGVGPATFMRLLGRHGTAQSVLTIARRSTGADDLVAAGLPAPGLSPSVAVAIVSAATEAVRLTRRLLALDLDVMTVEDVDYPTRLLHLEQPPPVLFVWGDRSALTAERTVAVVGTRRATEGAKRLAIEIGREISRAGGLVVSGLALGIDGAAHAGAVKAGRPTVGVLGSGHGRLYPAAHRQLAREMIGVGGCVISELPPDASGNRGTFPRRNRVISGLADATVVVEAPRGSGALITADWALEQGRECFIVPGPVGAHACAGSLQYLRAYHGQARVVATMPLLLEDLGFQVDVRPARLPAALAMGATETAIASLIISGHATVDSLAAATGIPVATILSAVTLLEMRGLVAAAYGRYRPTGALLPQIQARGGPRSPPKRE